MLPASSLVFSWSLRPEINLFYCLDSSTGRIASHPTLSVGLHSWRAQSHGSPEGWGSLSWVRDTLPWTLETDIQIPCPVNGSYWKISYSFWYLHLTTDFDQWVPSLASQSVYSCTYSRKETTHSGAQTKTFSSPKWEMKIDAIMNVKNPWRQNPVPKSMKHSNSCPVTGQRAAYRGIGAEFQFSDKILLGTMREHFSAS